MKICHQLLQCSWWPASNIKLNHDKQNLASDREGLEGFQQEEAPTEGHSSHHKLASGADEVEVHTAMDQMDLELVRDGLEF